MENEIPNTTLNRSQYIDKVDEWFKNNPNQWDEIYKKERYPWTHLQKNILEPELGKPYWTYQQGNKSATGLVPDGNNIGEPFTIYRLDDKKAGFKSDARRRQTRGAEFRRAALNDQTLTLEDYYQYADNNGLDDQLAESLYNRNVRKLSLLKRHKGKLLKNKNLRTVYEHLIPTTSKTWGGVEHWRNILLWDDKTNGWKSDAMPSQKAAIEAGIPRSKWEALEMDFAGGLEDQGIPYKVRRSIILNDLQKNPLVSARQANKNPSLLNDFVSDISDTVGRSAKTLSKVTSGAGVAESFLLLGSGQVVPGSIGLAMQTPAVQKQVAKKLLKPVGTLLAKQGLKAVPGVSIGSGVLQSLGYLASRQYGKAALSVGGGVIGEFGPVGDVVQAMIDLGLTAHDIKTAKAKPKGDIDMTEGGKVSKYESGILHSATGQGDEAFDNVVNALKENPNRYDSSGFGRRMNIDDIGKALSRL